MGKPEIRIFHNLARSGGTLICRCLGCMQDIVLLSEIHPLGTHTMNPITQAHNWYGLIHREDLMGKESIDFLEIIQLIERRCAESSRCLVIRDWSHLDFMGLPFLEKPSYQMLLVEALSAEFEMLRLALVRHPVDQWLSQQKLSAFQTINLDMFLRGYLEYAKKIQFLDFIRYEDFTQKPEEQLQFVCEKMQIRFDKDFVTKWTDYKNISGDTPGHSRGSMLNTIAPLPRLPIENDLLMQFHKNDDYWKAIEILNYPDREKEYE